MADDVKDSTTKPAHKSKKLGVAGTVITACLGAATIAMNKAEYTFAAHCIWGAVTCSVGYAFAQSAVEFAAMWRRPTQP